MSAVEKTNSVLTQIKNLFVQKLNNPHKTEAQTEKGDRFTRIQQPEKVTYDLEDIAVHDAVKRPIKINDSNNIFFINHNDRNKAVKIDPGEYNLTEIQSAIQQQVNEEFGIGKVSLKMTVSGSDRFIYADDKKEEHVLDEQV
jgi:thiamine biosynthesis lipoprotein ApbE